MVIVLLYVSLLSSIFPDLSIATTSTAFPYLKLPLLHTHPYPPPPSQALFSDTSRLSSLHRHRHRRPQLPISSGASSGSGQYFVDLHLGTPPQRLLLVADTGSDLTWVTCSACRNCSSRAASFLARHSSSFSPHHCFSKSCLLVPQPKRAAHCNHTRLHSACRYEYSYSDGSLTAGFFSKDTTTFLNSSVKFRKLSFGCSFAASGPSISGPSFSGAQGVMGLGRGPISFSSQLGQKFGHKFSYCLMDYTLSPPPTSYLLIGGGGGSANETKMTYTPLLPNPLSPTFYYVGIQSVRISGIKLRISPRVFAIDRLGNGGTVIDSGTTLTFLAEPAYRKVLAAFEKLVKLPRAAEPSALGFDLCVNVSGIFEPKLPRMSFGFGGGAVFSPPPRNYFLDIAEGVKCLALQPVGSPLDFSVIGNLMQQGFLFEFDQDRSRLGFTRQGCGVP